MRLSFTRPLPKVVQVWQARLEEAELERRTGETDKFAEDEDPLPGCLEKMLTQYVLPNSQQLVAALNTQRDAHEGALAESRGRARREEDLMNQELSELSATQQRVKTDLEAVQAERDALTSEQGSVRQRINQMAGVGTGAHAADKVLADVGKTRRGRG